MLCPANRGPAKSKSDEIFFNVNPETLCLHEETTPESPAAESSAFQDVYEFLPGAFNGGTIPAFFIGDLLFMEIRRSLVQKRNPVRDLTRPDERRMLRIVW
ncbi:hypothetical protein PUN28_005787 [Cardiocondyla obscurior]|uniref:Uncharacterized protein n=1 Tax=Cardiocondyla obscurior TaxID=286306 RepID=A0AAW2G7L1_9HYME